MCGIFNGSFLTGFQVDLLGQEVDSLSSLVEKIYMALDHYSPILQHYAGVSCFLLLIGDLSSFLYLTFIFSGTCVQGWNCWFGGNIGCSYFRKFVKTWSKILQKQWKFTWNMKNVGKKSFSKWDIGRMLGFVTSYLWI